MGDAVRVDWPGERDSPVCHDLTQFTEQLHRAVRRAESTRRFWLRGPLRPLAVTVVEVDRAAYRSHPQRCESPACPTTAPLLGMQASGLATAPIAAPPAGDE